MLKWDNNFINTINVLDFLISLQNLQENSAQTNFQEVEEHFNNGLNTILKEIHQHLHMQDEKIDAIMKKLEVEQHDS